MTLLKKIWYWLTDRCECGGYFIPWDSRKAYCNKCDKKQ